jgi:peptide/nickel transport system permease protein
VPGDPVLTALQNNESFTGSRGAGFSAKTYNQTAEKLGLNKPDFYFSVVPSNYPRDLYDLSYLQGQFAFEVIQVYGHPQATVKLIDKMNQLLQNNSLGDQALINHLNNYVPDLATLNLVIEESGLIAENDTLQDINNLLIEIMNSGQKGISLMPKIIWHGFDNQYHIWVSRAFLLNFGTSINDGQPVVRKVYQALRWTLVINLLAIVVGYTLAILIGTYAGWKGGIFDTISNIILTGFYAIPVFWLATILVVFFTTSEYGNWTNIFPAAGIWKTDIGNTFTQIIRQNASLLIIPVLTLSTSLMAYIARIMRNSVIEEKNKSYVIHARVKGLSDRVILWKHVFRNASFPLITLLASVLPAAIAGSLVVEVICSIPGSGRLLFEAILDQEWAIVSAVVMISSLLTILGLLISDILYRLVDPRVKWDTL